MMLRYLVSPALSNRPVRKLLLTTMVTTMVALSLVACTSEEGDAQEGGDAQAPTQVAAKVGDTEITVHQINHVLGNSLRPGASQDTVQAASNQILTRLIDQQLAADAATETRLHRSPEVIKALEAARKEVLARAYLQKITSAITKATPEEIRTYYAENPALFAERRVYSLQEIRIPDASKVLPELHAMAERERPIEEIANFLYARQIEFTGDRATRAAEQIPLELLSRLHPLKNGQSLVLDNGTSAVLIRIADSQSMPLSEEQASAGIEQFKNNRRASEAVNQAVKRLREASTIVYMGDFAEAAQAAPAASPGTLTPSLTDGTPAADAPAAAGTAPDPSAMDRGLQGIR